ncbi:MAG: 4Fe-4S dicluster domain-containing protein [Armatimonadetes bacterium]|nr:4Fe-4S dicluster domain-containing protein [Armatimonadota bacterium]
MIVTDCCKGCSICVAFCPLQVLEMSETFNKKGYHPPVAAHEEKCVNCGLCEMICPDFAIFSLPVNGSPGEGHKQEKKVEEKP